MIAIIAINFYFTKQRTSELFSSFRKLKSLDDPLPMNGFGRRLAKSEWRRIVSQHAWYQPFVSIFLSQIKHFS